MQGLDAWHGLLGATDLKKGLSRHRLGMTGFIDQIPIPDITSLYLLAAFSCDRENAGWMRMTVSKLMVVSVSVIMVIIILKLIQSA